MRVTTELADLEFEIGEVSRSENDLVIESAANSTIAVRILVSPRDALAALGRLMTSAGLWAFLLRLPFALMKKRAEQSGHDSAWDKRRSTTGLNKPW